MSKNIAAESLKASRESRCRKGQTKHVEGTENASRTASFRTTRITPQARLPLVRRIRMKIMDSEASLGNEVMPISASGIMICSRLIAICHPRLIAICHFHLWTTYINMTNPAL
ncbi:MAG: hypothetical protein LBR80_13895 [Deltaproteobacteria bacterium]|jgi:hypothetical protein|nr:hypothetical protein [Deltaproteobacteria bacterium]